MSLDKEKAIAILVKRIDVPGALFDIIDEILEPALDELVKASTNPYDDLAKAALYPILDKLLKEEAQKLWDKIQEK